MPRFRRGLNALGWIEGKNIRIETRWGVGDADRVQPYAKDLVPLRPMCIYTTGTPSTAALKRATSSIPIVFAIVADPVGDGLVASLSRPGGNITGFSSFDSEYRRQMGRTAEGSRAERDARRAAVQSARPCPAAAQD